MQIRFALPPWTPAVKWLVIANGIAAVLTIIATYHVWRLPRWLNADGPNAVWGIGGLDMAHTIFRGQVWRLITSQYLHGGASHLVFNMIGLYFFGPPIERQFGTKTFLWFYTFCGVTAGLLYLVLSGILGAYGFLIGASGCVLGLLAGCAILFPRMYLLIVPIRVAAVLYVIFYVLSIVWEWNLSDAAHLGGMVGATAWIVAGRRMEGWPVRRSARSWEHKQADLAREQAEVDRILGKVHEKGIRSLSWFEKRTLRRATERQRQRDREVDAQFRRR